MTDKQCIGKIIGLFLPYRKRLINILFCMIISSIISVVIPIISQNIMDFGFLNNEVKVVVVLSLLLLILYIASVLIDIVKEKSRLKLSAEFNEELNRQFFRHIINIKTEYLETKNSSEILNQAEIDLSAITSLSDTRIFYAITKLLSMIGGFIGLCIINVEMAVLVLLFIPIKCVILTRFSNKRRDKYNDYININGEYSSWLGETISGLNEIRNFGIKKEKEKELSQYQKRLNHTNYELNIISEYNGSIDSLLINILQILIYILGIFYITKQGFTVGSIFAFVTYSTYVTQPVISILNIALLLSGVFPSAKRYFEFREKEEEEDTSEIVPSKEFSKLNFNNVSFKYGEKNIFNNLSFSINAGDKVAIIGGNGVGKSTLIKLIMRVYNPNSGAITYNNDDIGNYDLESYRKVYAIVNQSVYLFNTSIIENVTLYSEKDSDRVRDALINSGLSEFTEDYGLNYIVGDNGVKLSGGQRQKVALARAFYRNKEIYILDEANSNADIYYERQMEELLIEKMKEKTLILITHRLEILSKVDKIVFLKRNQEFAVGGYEELLNTDKEFKNMLLEYVE